MKNLLKKLISATLVLMLMVSLCTPVFNVSAAEGLSTVTQWNLVLCDNIAANFHIRVADSVSTNAAIHVSDGYGTTEYPLEQLNKDENGDYIVTAYLAAAQMADPIVIQLFDGETYGEQHTYNAVDYAHYILDGAYSANTKSMVKAMLDYGAAAQYYFDYNTENPANKGLETEVTANIPQANSAMVNGNVDGIHFYGASLVFASKVAVRYYFVVDGDISSYTFGGYEAVKSDELYYVEISDINPQDYSEDIVLSVSDGSNTMDITYSPLCYISRMYYKNTNALLTDLVEAMYIYGLAAQTYIENPDEQAMGAAFRANEGIRVSFESKAYNQISFDYMLEGEGQMSVILRDPENWTTKTYGDYTFNSTGLVYDYGNYQSGITCQTLENGYVRVTMKLDELSRSGLVDNRDAAPTNVGVLDIYEWTNVNGYIANVVPAIVDTYRGEAFTGGVDNLFTLPTEAVSSLSFDYLLTTEGDIHVILRNSAWSAFYGDFELDANGKVWDYQTGITITKLDDGYTNVRFDLAELNRAGLADNLDAAPASVGIIDLFNWGTASGYIDNIQIDVAPTMPEISDIEFTAGNECYTEIPAGDYEAIQFQYKLDTDGQMYIVLRDPNWSTYYGDFAFDADGKVWDYQTGIYCEKKTDGYIQVTMVMDELNRTKSEDNCNYAPDSIGVFDVLSWTTTNGKVENIELLMEVPDLPEEPEGTEPVVPEPEIATVPDVNFVAGGNQFFAVPENDYKAVSFEYKLDTDGELCIILRDGAWSKFYGDYRFTSNGLAYTYESYTNGIFCEPLSDGYIKVTMLVDALGRAGLADNRNGAPETIGLFDVFSWTSANGSIRNIQLSTEAPVIRGEAFVGGVTKTIYLSENVTENLSFDYKLTSGGDMRLILRAPDWNGFYGDFTFDADGLVYDYQTGITTEKLEDGYIRVYVDFAELNRSGCMDDRNSAPASVGIFDIYEWGTANGYIDNIQLS